MNPEQPKDNNYFEDGLGENVYETERSLNQKPKDKQDWKEKFETFKIFLDWFINHVVEPLQQSNEALQKEVDELGEKLSIEKMMVSKWEKTYQELKKENERLREELKIEDLWLKSEIDLLKKENASLQFQLKLSCEAMAILREQRNQKEDENEAVKSENERLITDIESLIVDKEALVKDYEKAVEEIGRLQIYLDDADNYIDDLTGSDRG